MDCSGEDTTAAQIQDCTLQSVLSTQLTVDKQGAVRTTAYRTWSPCHFCFCDKPVPGPSLTFSMFQGSSAFRWLIGPKVTAPALAARHKAGNMSIWHIHSHRLQRWGILKTLEGLGYKVTIEWQLSQSWKSKLVTMISIVVLNLSSSQNFLHSKITKDLKEFLLV